MDQEDVSRDRHGGAGKKKLRITPKSTHPIDNGRAPTNKILEKNEAKENCGVPTTVHVPRVRTCEGDSVGRSVFAPALSSLPPPVRMTPSLEWTPDMEALVAQMCDRVGSIKI